MPEETRFVIAHVDDGVLAAGGLRWCLAVEAPDGALQPLAWVRSREEATHLLRAFPAEPEGSPATARRNASRQAHTKPPPPLSLLEKMAVAAADPFQGVDVAHVCIPDEQMRPMPLALLLLLFLYILAGLVVLGVALTNALRHRPSAVDWSQLLACVPFFLLAGFLYTRSAGIRPRGHGEIMPPADAQDLARA